MNSIPNRGVFVTLAGMAVNLCLGILYAWSVWKGSLLPPKPKEGETAILPGTPMTGLNEGWNYLSDSQATWAFSICGAVFALFMIPGGRLQDRFGPRIGATLAGVCLGVGCVISGLMQSYLGLILGFGILGGIGMGLGYAAATPAAVRWFGQHRRGLVAGLVVAGYGGAAIYISPFAKWLIAEYGITGSFLTLGGLFAFVIIVAGQFLRMPPPGFVASQLTTYSAAKAAATDRTASQMLKTWQFYVLVLLFAGSAQAGLLMIANATPILGATAANIAFFAMNVWLLSAYGGIVNASGRVGTGFYSDAVGRVNAFTINGLASVVCLILMPTIMEMKNIWLLFLLVGIIYWQYGGTLSLMPAWTADFYGSKNLGLNYGLVFMGWGIAFFVPQIAGFIKDITGNMNGAFYLSAGIVFVVVIVSRFVKRPS